MLEARGLCKSYGSRAVVSDLSLAVGGGRDRRPARAERRRQVDHGRDALRPHRRRPRRGVRRRGADARAADASTAKRRAAHRPRAAGPLALRGPRRRGNLELFGALYGLSGALLRRARRRGARAGRPRRPGEGQARHLQRRHEAPPQHRRGAGPRPRRAALRRADRRRRSAEPQRHLRQPRGAARGAARRCSTPRTTWRRPSACATASSSSTTARSSPATRSPASSGCCRRRRRSRSRSTACVDLAALGALPGIDGVTQDGGLLRAGVADLARDAPALLAALAASGRRVSRIASARPGLEDVFLSLTGRQLRD